MFYTSLVLCLWTLVGVISDEVKSVSVMEGDSVTLYSNITEIQSKDVIEWRFEEIRIARIKRLFNINPIYDDNDETQRFRDRLKLNNQTGDLIITDITTEHTGLYQLKIIIANNQTVKSFNVTVNVSSTVSITESPQNPSGGIKSDDKLLIYCAAAAGGSLMIVASVLIFWICRKHKNKHQQDQTAKDEITYADPTFYKRKAQTKRVDDDVVYAGVVRC